MNHPSPAIECMGLTKDYGEGRGVFGLDLTVRAGEVFGFVGPNGAGKTTTIRLLMDLIRPDAGTARVFGLDVRSDSLAVKRLVGYLPGEPVRFPGVSGGHVIRLLAGIRGGVQPDRIDELCARFQLNMKYRYEELSHGNKQKVALIQAFMHDPALLILDEPTLGLDPLMQRQFRTLVRERSANGAAVFLSSHILSEVEQVCDRIAFIRAGSLVRIGTLEQLRALRVHRIIALCEVVPDLTELRHTAGVDDVSVEDHRVSCSVRGDVSPLLKALVGAGVKEIDSTEISLEEIFVSEYQERVAGVP